jgi:hypothetical protein
MCVVGSTKHHTCSRQIHGTSARLFTLFTLFMPHIVFLGLYRRSTFRSMISVSNRLEIAFAATV